jgi:acetyltransferase
LLKRLLDVARQEKLQRVTAVMTPENEGMQRICKQLGFTLAPVDDKMIEAEIKL